MFLLADEWEDVFFLNIGLYPDFSSFVDCLGALWALDILAFGAISKAQQLLHLIATCEEALDYTNVAKSLQL